MIQRVFITLIVFLVLSGVAVAATKNVTLYDLVYKIDPNNNRILRDTCIVIGNPNNEPVTMTLTSYLNNGQQIHAAFYSLNPFVSVFPTLTEGNGLKVPDKSILGGQIPALFPFPFEGYLKISATKPINAYRYYGIWEYDGSIDGDERLRGDPGNENWSDPVWLWFDVDISLSYYTTYYTDESGGKNCYALPWVDVWTPCAEAGHTGWNVTFKLLNYSYQWQFPDLKLIRLTGLAPGHTEEPSDWFELAIPPAQSTYWGFRPGEVTVSMMDVIEDLDFWSDGACRYPNGTPSQWKFGGIVYVESLPNVMLLNNRVFSLQ